MARQKKSNSKAQTHSVALRVFAAFQVPEQQHHITLQLLYPDFATVAFYLPPIPVVTAFTFKTCSNVFKILFIGEQTGEKLDSN